MRQRRSLKLSSVWAALAVLIILSFAPFRTAAQSCETASDMDAATQSALTATGQRYFDMTVKGDTLSLRQNAVGSLAADFSGIEGAIQDHQKDLAGAKATVKSVFLLGVDGSGPLAHGEFYCGVFGKNG
jgi:hypothetical protein